MKQIVQPLSGGPVEVFDVPCLVISLTEVLVCTVPSVISPGTEWAVITFARSGLPAKARAWSDLVRQVVRKANAEGIPATVRTVRGWLAADAPLGYAAAGVMAEVGAAVDGIGAGQLVATGAPPKTGKDRIEVLAGSHQAIIDDFRSVQVDGRTLWKGRQDKRHGAHATAFRQAVRDGLGMLTEAILGTMRATIQAADRAFAS